LVIFGLFNDGGSTASNDTLVMMKDEKTILFLQVLYRHSHGVTKGNHEKHVRI